MIMIPGGTTELLRQSAIGRRSNVADRPELAAISTDQRRMCSSEAVLPPKVTASIYWVARNASSYPETVGRERLLPGIQICIYLRGWNCYVTGGPLRLAAEDKGVPSSNGSSFSCA